LSEFRDDLGGACAKALGRHHDGDAAFLVAFDEAG